MYGTPFPAISPLICCSIEGTAHSWLVGSWHLLGLPSGLWWGCLMQGVLCWALGVAGCMQPAHLPAEQHVCHPLTFDGEQWQSWGQSGWLQSLMGGLLGGLKPAERRSPLQHGCVGSTAPMRTGQLQPSPQHGFYCLLSVPSCPSFGCHPHVQAICRQRLLGDGKTCCQESPQ